MQLLVPILLTLLAGIGIAVQPPVNGVLARASGSVILAALVSFAVGTVALLALWLAADRTPAAGLRGVPWWAWTGGLYGVVYVSISAFAAPRLGLASMLTIAIAAQLIAALTIDHFGWLRLAQSPISLVKVMGVVLVLGGVVLVRRG